MNDMRLSSTSVGDGTWAERGSIAAKAEVQLEAQASISKLIKGRDDHAEIAYYPGHALVAENLQKPSSGGWFFHVNVQEVQRTSEQKAAYQVGVAQVKNLLKQEFGGNVGKRFDHYCVVNNLNKETPLTVGQLKNFIHQESSKLDINNLAKYTEGKIIVGCEIEEKKEGKTESKIAVLLQEKPTSLQVLRRGNKERDAYRRGMEQVRNLLFEEFDSNAVERFDKEFAYRYSYGKPLSIGALKVFVEHEKELRTKGVFDITKVALSQNTLEDLKGKIAQQEGSIVGVSHTKMPQAPQKYWFPVLTSWFESRAEAEDLREAKQAGVIEARHMIEVALAGHYGKEKILASFDLKFVTGTTEAETSVKVELTVKTLTSFVDASIQARDDADSLWFQLNELETVTEDAIKKIALGYKNRIMSAMNDKVAEGAHLMEVALLLKSTASASNITTMVAKDVIIGGTLATLSPRERLVTLLLAH